MNRTVRNLLLTGLLLSSWVGSVFGQGDECDVSLAHAESEFSAGHFYAIPGLLSDCLNQNVFSQEQKVRAYLLLCQAYLINDDPIAADDSYLKLLEANPEYVADENTDPIDVVYLSKKFTATPIFTPHVRVGMNTTLYRSIYSITTEPYNIGADNTFKLGWQVGGGIDWNINENISLCAEIDISSRQYKRTQTDLLSGGDVSTVSASQFWIDLPLYVKYSYDVGTIRPFGYLGFAMNYMTSAKNEFTFTDKKTSGSQLLVEGPSEDVRYQRNSLNRSWIIGGGIKYKKGKDFYFVDLRYMGGMTNMANESKIYYAEPSINPDPNPVGNPDYYVSDNVTRYRYVSDLFRLDNVFLSFGYIRPIYDPRKIKKARTKKLSRKIIREEGGKGQ